MIPRSVRSAARLCTANSRVSSSEMHRLQMLSHRYKTILAGVDGTKYGYVALEEAFNMSNAGDEIIGYHVPLDSYQFAYEHLVFQTGNSLSQSQRKEYEEKKQKFIDLIDEKVVEIKSQRLKPHVTCIGTINLFLYIYGLVFVNQVEFRFIVGSDSIAIKQDLVDACDEFNADTMVCYLHCQ